MSNPSKIEVMITSLIEMPELASFGHMSCRLNQPLKTQ